MKLITNEVLKNFEKYPIRSQEGKGMDAKVLVKFFNPYGRGTWLITEAEKQEDGDWLLFGYMHIYDWEWGYVMLSEITDTKVNVYGAKLPLERDLYAKGTVRELAD